MATTWDGLPIADDHPRGASVTVQRSNGTVLLLHRAHHGPAYDGDWAWTPPSGSRRPDEPIFVATLRELAEEAGLIGVEPAPIDLSGEWAFFTIVVSADAHVTLVDPEHDQFAWVRPDDAYARCRPQVVADGLRRALATRVHDIAFRPMVRGDLPAMKSWLHAPHVARWWHRIPEDLAALEAKYGPRVDGDPSIDTDVVLVAGDPVGFIQSYPITGDVEYPAVVAAATDGGVDAVGIDYAIGDPAIVGVGLGTQMMWAYVRHVILARRPATRYIVADPDPSNVASVRAVAKAGFQPSGTFANADGDHALYVLDRRRVFG